MAINKEPSAIPSMSSGDLPRRVELDFGFLAWTCESLAESASMCSGSTCGRCNLGEVEAHVWRTAPKLAITRTGSGGDVRRPTSKVTAAWRRNGRECPGAWA